MSLLRELANPNLHDIPTNLPFRVELWDRTGQHTRWAISASTSVAVGHAALDAAIASLPARAPYVTQWNSGYPRTCPEMRTVALAGLCSAVLPLGRWRS
jgi:hypothetical protein